VKNPYRQAMPRWTCDRCGREFGRTNQQHMCRPALSLDEYFAARPAFERAIFDAVAEALAVAGPVHVEAVDIGILLKRSRTFAELRPKRHTVAMWVLLSREVAHPRITRAVRASAGRVAHFLELRGAEDVDDDVRSWLLEAYFASPE
jgi:hypothetical protein